MLDRRPIDATVERTRERTSLHLHTAGARAYARQYLQGTSARMVGRDRLDVDDDVLDSLIACMHAYGLRIHR